jgi:hypothetical protein
VTGRIFAGRLNLDSDGQADLRAHGGEQRALVYQLESYRYWASRGIATKARMSDHSSWPPNTVRGSYRHSGQHIMVRMRPGPDAPAVTRNCSLCGPPEAPTYRIAVKDERGLASGFLHQSVRAGSRLEISAPRGSFVLAAGKTPVVLIRAGVGVIRLAIGPPFVCKEADGLLAALRASHRCVIYSRPAPADLLGPDFDRSGHLSRELLQGSASPRTLTSTCVVRPAFSKIFRVASQHGAFPGPGSTSSCSGARPLSHRASPASPRPGLIVLTAPQAATHGDVLAKRPRRPMGLALR